MKLEREKCLCIYKYIQNIEKNLYDAEESIEEKKKRSSGASRLHWSYAR